MIATLQRLQSRMSGSHLLSGSVLLLVSMTIVNAGNYLLNLILGRWLGPAAFADLSLIVTLMLMITLVTVALQTVAARFAAVYAANTDQEQLHSLRRWMLRWSWGMGGVLLLLFTLTTPFWTSFFHLASPWPFVILALGLPFYFAQGVDRGMVQGQMRFGVLSTSYQIEMWTRLAATLTFVAIGWSVQGAVAGLTLSFAATWFVGAWMVNGRVRLWATSHQHPPAPLPQQEQRQMLQYAGPVCVALVGQILINNSDILIVKRFFLPEAAGQYAALALIGRIVFFATWSVVTALFPIVAQRHARGEPHRHLLGIGLGVVAIISVGIIGSTLVLPDLIVQVLFGAAYLTIAPLLWLYAIATALYALANVLITYRLSIGNGWGSILAVLAGLAQVGSLWFFHTSLREVVIVQVALMSLLLGSLLVWDIWLWLRVAKPTRQREDKRPRRRYWSFGMTVLARLQHNRHTSTGNRNK